MHRVTLISVKLINVTLNQSFKVCVRVFMEDEVLG
jgi:hypothetical protein